MDPERIDGDQESGEDEATSIRNSVVAALEQHRGESDDGTAAPETPGASTAAAPAGDGEQTRGADGRFAKATDTNTTAAATGDKPAAPAAATSDQASATTGAAPTAPAESAPPASWSAAEKAAWGKAPPEVQAAVLRRERDFSEGIRQQAEKFRPAVEFTNGILQRLKPHESEYRAQGMNEAQAVAWLISMHEWAKRDLQGYARHVAQAAGIVLPEGHQAPSASAAGGQPPAAAPAVQDPLLGQLTRKVDELTGFVSEEKRARTEAAQAADMNAVATFQKAAGADGKLLYPHFDAVREDMARAADALPPNTAVTQEVLAQLYERAIWSNPEVRAKLLQERETAAATSQQEAAKAAAVAARKAATPTVGNPGGATSAELPGESVEGDLRAAFRLHNQAA